MTISAKEVYELGELSPGTTIRYAGDTRDLTIFVHPLPDNAPEYLRKSTGGTGVIVCDVADNYWAHSVCSNRIAKDVHTFRRLNMGSNYGDGWIVTSPPEEASSTGLVLPDGPKEWDE